MERLATAIASFLANQLDLDSEQRDVLRFGALTALLHAASVLTVIIIGALTGILGYVLTSTLTVMTIRHASGGPHVQTPLRCYITSSVALLILGYVGAGLGPAFATQPLAVRMAVVIGAAFPAVAGLYKYAPVEAPRRPLSPQHRANMRRLSIRLGVIVSLLSIAGAVLGIGLTVSVLLGLIFQVVTLTPTGCFAVNLIDHHCILEGRSRKE